MKASIYNDSNSYTKATQSLNRMVGGDIAVPVLRTNKEIKETLKVNTCDGVLSPWLQKMPQTETIKP